MQIDNYAREVRGRTDDARAVTRVELENIQAALQRVEEVTGGQSQSSSDAFQTLAAHRGRLGVARAISDINTQLERNIAPIQRGAMRSSEVAAVAVERCAEIAKAQKTIMRMAHRSHFLAINTAINAAIAGERGLPIASIAAEMDELNIEVEVITERIHVLTEQLMVLMPEFSATADSLASEAEVHAKELMQYAGDAATAGQELQKGLERLVSQSDECNERVADTIRSALDELAFQGDLFEELGRVDQCSEALARHAHRLLKETS